MRVIFYIEPTIARSDPTLLKVHLYWARMLISSLPNSEDFLVVSNYTICEEWARIGFSLNMQINTHEIDCFNVLQEFKFQTLLYREALYDETYNHGVLFESLFDVRQKFDPDLVVMTWQSSIARAAFDGVPIVSIEQPPLARMGHPQRTAFDPVGHQTSSMLDRYRARVRGAKLPPNQVTEMVDLTVDLRTYLRSDSRLRSAQDELIALSGGAKIALLATQPPNKIPCNDSLDTNDVVSLLCSWEEQLPSGWIGVPTFYSGYELPMETQAALERSRDRLKFLSENHSSNATEALICMADGLVTVNSSSAMMGLLFGKQVVSVGQAPLRSWGGNNVMEIDKAPIMDNEEVAATLAFLTYRFSHTDDQIRSDPDIFREIIEVLAGDKDAPEWFLDLSGWSPANARSMFNGMC